MTKDRISLVPQRREMLASMGDASTFARAESVVIRDVQLPTLKALLTESLDFYDQIGAEDPWRGYLCVREADRVVVGCCGFKGDPVEGAVEIAYFTFPEFEGSGYATAAAQAMVRVAASTERVGAVIAQTKPVADASTRVLERVGFERVGEGHDEETGPVWRWRLELGGGVGG